MSFVCFALRLITMSGINVLKGYCSGGEEHRSEKKTLDAPNFMVHTTPLFTILSLTFVYIKITKKKKLVAFLARQQIVQPSQDTERRHA